MNRINKKFENLQLNNQKAFIGYITAGDPNLDKTEEFVYALEEGGTHIVELGIPFSDPLADGPVIQAAGQRALNAGITVDKIFRSVMNIRKNTDVPLVFLVYYNTIIIYGKERFIKRCEETGVDGLIIPDLPLEERDELTEIMNYEKLCFIPLVAPTSKDRISKIVEGCKGFVYCVSSLGVTGEKSNFYKDIKSYLQDVKKKSDIPIAVGFGISSKEDIKKLENDVDGVIVGSAIVNEIRASKGDTIKLKEYIAGLCG
ncbi:tryptophan synthase alpha chain [Vallitalea longa]|uniref:Tryptophan synthase alpha chain n=1 Tax=Vallitalea longa TaxID=2936439 RepID=A0A9W5Y8W9_9FIRM|nr:tryptophan synthase subunit alpha [Vallitalea longa]GKX29395.1 tryptophan synthase alpha chain [Vallitalea longa]